MAEEKATLIIRIKKVGGRALQSVVSGVKKIGAAAAIAGVAIVGFVAKSVAAFRVQELAINKLNQSLVQQGIFTRELSKEYQDMASALQKVTLFGDEAIISSQAQLQSYLGQTKITKETMLATLDFASAMGVDLKTAADLVGKSIGSSTNALSRYGIEVDTSLTKSQKMTAVTKALNDKFGGQAAAATDGLGALTQMKNAIGDVMEVVGKQFAPLIVDIAKRITTFAEEVQNSKESLEGLFVVARFITKIFFVLKNATVTLGKVIGTGLATAVESVTAATKLQFAQAKEISIIGAASLRKILREGAQATADDLATIDEKTQAQDAERADNTELLKTQSQLRNQQIQAENRQEAALVKAEEDIEQQELDMAFLNASEEERLQITLSFFNKRIAAEKDKNTKLALLSAKASIIEIQKDKKKQKAEEELNRQKINDRKATGDTIATLQNSNNRTLAIAGKAAAITQVAIQAPAGIAKALGAFPPPFNFIAAALVAAAFATQAGRIAGLQLQEGGVILPSPGGTQATIGEGGRSEAVVPLPDDFDADEGGGFGGGTTVININGATLATPEEARDFAILIDKGLLELRRTNESVAFEEDVI